MLLTKLVVTYLEKKLKIKGKGTLVREIGLVADSLVAKHLLTYLCEHN